MKEAAVRIKINKQLEAAAWCFFAEGSAPADIQLEPKGTLKTQDIDSLDENIEKAQKDFPFIVLEAQAGKYARSQNCRFVILSNSNLKVGDLQRSRVNLLEAAVQSRTFPQNRGPSHVQGGR